MPVPMLDIEKVLRLQNARLSARMSFSQLPARLEPGADEL